MNIRKAPSSWMDEWIRTYPYDGYYLAVKRNELLILQQCTQVSKWLQWVKEARQKGEYTIWSHLQIPRKHKLIHRHSAPLLTAHPSACAGVTQLLVLPVGIPPQRATPVLILWLLLFFWVMKCLSSLTKCLMSSAIPVC